MSATPETPSPVTWSVSDEGVAEIHMRDRNGRNALSDTFVEALVHAVTAAVSEPKAKVLVLLGTDEVFSSGAPKEMLLRIVQGDLAPSEIRLPKVLLDLPLPMIAAMEGHAIGGGFAIGLCADIVLIARESRYGCNFMTMGLTPGMGTTRLLEHTLSPAVAHELLYTGELRRGSAFEGVGGFNGVLPRSEVPARAFDIAARIAEKPRLALEALKRSLSAPRRRLFEETFTVETMMHQVVLGAPEILRTIEDEYVE